MSAFLVSQAPGDVPVTIVTPQERINLTNTAELEAAVQQAYDDGMRNLLLDLSQTPSITSAGIRSIIIIYKLMAAAGPAPAEGQPRPKLSPHFKLLCPSPHVRQVLEIAGMTDRFEMYDDLETALKSFA